MQFLLHREPDSLCACSYAGGKGQPPGDGKVCYHNALQDHDYGSFGHAEVNTPDECHGDH